MTDSLTNGRSCLAGTHADIKVDENTVCRMAKVLVDAVTASGEVAVSKLGATVLSCNSSIAQMHIPEFFESDELGIRTPKSCKRCQGRRQQMN